MSSSDPRTSDTPGRKTSAAPVADVRPVPHTSIVVAALSTVVEWYDFTLYLFMTSILSRVMLGGGSDSVLAILAVFAISYVLRPLGALCFGYLGDRHGRRPVLLLSMAMMTVAMLATALLPTYDQVGPWAAALLLLMRCVTALSVGGEYTGVITYLVESAQPRRRGLVASIAAAASEVGALLAVAMTAFVTVLVPPPALDTWGWRIPFLVGALLALLTLGARSTMKESPEFDSARSSGENVRRPLSDALRHQRPAIYRTFVISALASITYYVGVSYLPTYLSTVNGLDEGKSLMIATAASLAVVLVTPCVGYFADRSGRRPVLVSLAALCIALPIGMFSALASNNMGVALGAAAVLALLAGGVGAVGASATPEQFSVPSRLSGLAVATVATTIFGGFMPYLSQSLIGTTGWTLIPGVLLTSVALFALPVLWRLPETAADRSGG